MLTSKKLTLKPILESSNGLHITIYLVNNNNEVELKSQLREAIDQSYEWLDPVMTVEEKKYFLEPLESLLLNNRIFSQMKGHIGIFRNKDLFRVLNLPVEVSYTCQVATSFHVKPLLKWLQTDQEFLLLGLNKSSTYLYMGSRQSFRLVDSISFLENFDDKTKFSYLNSWIDQITKSTKPKLFIAGEKDFAESFQRSLQYKNTSEEVTISSLDQNNILSICLHIRKILAADSSDLIKKALTEFRFAEEENTGRKNIFQISKAVVQGRVRKLIVTDEISIFGKIDKNTGGISIHPCDLDHEDDDILDDLAQMVLKQGGEVVVASKNEIPKGRSILAILDDEIKDLVKWEEIDKSNKLFEGSI